jgi:hypothetical protein
MKRAPVARQLISDTSATMKKEPIKESAPPSPKLISEWVLEEIRGDAEVKVDIYKMAEALRSISHIGGPDHIALLRRLDWQVERVVDRVRESRLRDLIKLFNLGNGNARVRIDSSGSTVPLTMEDIESWYGVGSRVFRTITSYGIKELERLLLNTILGEDEWLV